MVIQIINGWDNEHLHRFHIYAVGYGIHYIGGTCYRGSAYKIKLDDFEFSDGDIIYYEYNYFENHIVDIRVGSIEDTTTTDVTLFCTKGNGMVGVNNHDVIHEKYKLLKALAKATATTTVDEILPFVNVVAQTRSDSHLIKIGYYQIKPELIHISTVPTGKWRTKSQQLMNMK